MSWDQQYMAPELRVGDMVVLDNLALHLFAGVREATQAAGASMYYLPHCNLD